LEEVSQDSFLEPVDNTQVEEFLPRVSTQEVVEEFLPRVSTQEEVEEFPLRVSTQEEVEEEEEEEHLPPVCLPPAQGLEQSQ